MIKPKKVLCKRSLSTVGGKENITKGKWYKVVYNENDSYNTFTILNNQKKKELHIMYTEEDKKDWPDFCKEYGPRDYSKWFYTMDELRKLKINKINKL